MKDRAPRYPGRVLITPEAGEPYYAVVKRADEPTQEGAALNKKTLLKDTTAAAYGLGAAATPDEVLARLKESVLFRSGAFKNVLGSNITIPAAQLSERVQIAAGSYVGTGTSGESYPNRLYFPFSPKFVLVYGAFTDQIATYGILKAGAEQAVAISHSSSNNTHSSLWNQTLSGTSASWYVINLYGLQLNDSGRTYRWTAIG